MFHPPFDSLEKRMSKEMRRTRGYPVGPSIPFHVVGIGLAFGLLVAVAWSLSFGRISGLHVPLIAMILQASALVGGVTIVVVMLLFVRLNPSNLPKWLIGLYGTLAAGILAIVTLTWYVNFTS